MLNSGQTFSKFSISHKKIVFHLQSRTRLVFLPKIKPLSMEKEYALILTHGLLDTEDGKTAHGLIRSSDRFHIVGVIDFATAGRDAGEVLDGKHRNIPIFADIETALKSCAHTPQYLIIGVAVAGGKIPPALIDMLKSGIEQKLSIINGLHEKLNEKADFVALAKQNNVTITDVRRTKLPSEMSYWSGNIRHVKAPRVAVLGMDCAVGKRTTAKFLVEAMREKNYKAEMISTGQTGWMQDGRYAFILDSTINDFLTGELETQIIACDAEQNPDIIFLNGQSALRNPIGPTGSELLLSGGAKWVVLQAMPSRKYYEGTEHDFKAIIPSVKSEIQLIKMYGATTIAVTLNTHGLTLEKARAIQAKLRLQLGIPVVLPLEDGVGAVVEAIEKKILEITL
jgi:uncharacterized NAD-dependent epimerase/dehydratase family protein